MAWWIGPRLKENELCHMLPFIEGSRASLEGAPPIPHKRSTFGKTSRRCWKTLARYELLSPVANDLLPGALSWNQSCDPNVTADFQPGSKWLLGGQRPPHKGGHRTEGSAACQDGGADQADAQAPARGILWRREALMIFSPLCPEMCIESKPWQWISMFDPVCLSIDKPQSFKAPVAIRIRH